MDVAAVGAVFFLAEKTAAVLFAPAEKTAVAIWIAHAIVMAAVLREMTAAPSVELLGRPERVPVAAVVLSSQAVALTLPSLVVAVAPGGLS